MEFELKNSHMPIYILHDLFLESGELSAQIDYLVITKTVCFVIECKNLYGNIEINDSGDFIRTMDFGGKKKKEGVYSPITQNQRHLQLIKKMKLDCTKNFIFKAIVEKSFDNWFKSIVVLVNPKTVLNAKNAKREIKEQVIRADQLVEYIKNVCQQSKETPLSDEKTLALAQSFLSIHKEADRNYTKKYEPYIILKKKTFTYEESINAKVDVEKHEEKVNIVSEKILSIPIEETALFKELKEYRLKKSREEKIKPYFIYNNMQMKDLVARMPKNHQELLAISGFGDAKVNKYGEDLLQIINNHTSSM